MPDLQGAQNAEKQQAQNPQVLKKRLNHAIICIKSVIFCSHKTVTYMLLLKKGHNIDLMSQQCIPLTNTIVSCDEGFIFKTTGKALCGLILVCGSILGETNWVFMELMCLLYKSQIYS